MSSLYEALYNLLSHLTEEQRQQTVRDLGENAVVQMSGLMTTLEEKLPPE